MVPSQPPLPNLSASLPALPLRLAGLCRRPLPHPVQWTGHPPPRPQRFSSAVARGWLGDGMSAHPVQAFRVAAAKRWPWSPTTPHSPVLTALVSTSAPAAPSRRAALLATQLSPSYHPIRFHHSGGHSRNLLALLSCPRPSPKGLTCLDHGLLGIWHQGGALSC